MWPNPNDGQRLNLHAELEKEVTTATVDIFDIYGKRVQSEVITVNGVELNSVIELNNTIASGLYMVTITAGEASFTQRLVIQ